MSSNHPYTVLPKLQAVASTVQAAPVQNTWYTILDTVTNARIILITLLVATTGEDLELKLTIDGETITSPSIAAAAGIPQRAYWNSSGVITLSTSDYQSQRAYLVEGRSVKIEMRKTTAAGAGNLTGYVLYALY